MAGAEVVDDAEFGLGITFRHFVNEVGADEAGPAVMTTCLYIVGYRSDLWSVVELLSKALKMDGMTEFSTELTGLRLGKERQILTGKHEEDEEQEFWLVLRSAQDDEAERVDGVIVASSHEPVA